MTDATAPLSRMREEAHRPSLPEVHATVAVPEGGSWLRKLFAFMGPGYLISVGYMDPGNWATDLAGGARFGYTLVSMNPCSYTPPFSGVMHQHFELAVHSETDGDTDDIAAVLLDQVKRIREAHQADAYDAAVGELVLITDPLRKKDTPKK